MQQFEIREAFILNVAGVFTSFKKGTYNTEDEVDIKALTGSKGAVSVEVEQDEDEELASLQAEYLAKFGKKPHHLAGIDKLKAEIADFDKTQED